MKPTLHDIAAATGFSISTVSRVLSGSSKISDAARSAIITTAQRMHYPISRVRADDRAKAPLDVALVTDFHEGEFYASYFYGFALTAPAFNLRVALHSLNQPPEEIVSHLLLLTGQRYDGVILFLPELTHDDYGRMMAGLPDRYPILSNAHLESPVIPTITFDGYGAGYVAAEHFMDRGFRTVGLVKGPANKAETSFRNTGFRDACARHNDRLHLTWEFQGDFGYQSGMDAFAEWNRQPPAIRPRAVFLSNDLMANAFLEAARISGIRIPEDVAILGYDDLPMSRHSHPDISSIRTDFATLARTTLRTLRERILHPEHPVGIQSLIPVSLVARTSTGPA
jgi:DNA-binding LacI/PurR family transcriptional regulator